MAYELGMLMWACLAEDVIIEKRPSLMCVILSNLQAFLTYTSMVKTNRFTIETIEYIQEVVDKSELFTRLSVQLYFSSVSLVTINAPSTKWKS